MNFLIIFLLSLCVNQVALENARCDYKIDSVYKCMFHFYTRGYIKITQIIGNHLREKNDGDVYEVERGSDIEVYIFPSFICDKFKNVKKIWLRDTQMEQIDENSLKNCVNLEHLSLTENNIKKLPENLFSANLRLKELYLLGNQIEELPRGIFTHLQDLENVWLPMNKLSTLHSDSFGYHPHLYRLHIDKNQVKSFDERIIKNTPVLRQIHIGPNPCVNKNDFFVDNTETRSDIKAALKKCFENYQNENNRLPKRVFYLEDDKGELKMSVEKIQAELSTLINSEIKKLKNADSDLKASVENDNNELRKEIQEMKNKIQLLTKESEDLKTENALMKSEIVGKMQSEIKKLESDESEIMSKVHTVENAVNQEIESLKSANQKLLLENQLMKNEFEAGIGENMQKIQSTMKSMKDQYEKSVEHQIVFKQLISTSRELSAEYKAVNDEIKILTSKTNKIIAEISTLQNDKKENTSVTNEIDLIYLQTVNDIKRDIYRLRKINDELSSENLMNNVTLQNLFNKIEGLTAESQATNDELKISNKQITKLMTKCNDMKLEMKEKC